MSNDKVYTNHKGLLLISKVVSKKIDINLFDEVIDPCAGGGQFKSILPVTHQYDIEPDSSDVIKMDFFDLELDITKRAKRLIICSPPFGVNFDLGTRFLLKASSISSTIISIVSKHVDIENLIYGFKLIHSEEFLGKCFIKDGEDIEINHLICVWVKSK